MPLPAARSYRQYLKPEILICCFCAGDRNFNLLGDTHDKKTVIDDGLSLKSWLCNTPLYLQLQWFDTVENVDVSVKLKRRRWTSEITARDALYLEKLGVILS